MNKPIRKRYAVMANAPPPGATMGTERSWPMRVMSESDKPLGAAIRAFAIVVHRKDASQVYLYDRWGQSRLWCHEAAAVSSIERCQQLMRFLRNVIRWSRTYEQYGPHPHLPI